MKDTGKSFQGIMCATFRSLLSFVKCLAFLILCTIYIFRFIGFSLLLLLYMFMVSCFVRLVLLSFYWFYNLFKVGTVFCSFFIKQ